MGRRDALIEKFRAITGERVARLRQGVSALQHQPHGAYDLTEVSREIHTLKGEAKLLGFATISRVALAVEELLPLGEQQAFAATSEAVEQILAGFALIDRLRTLPASDPEVEAAEQAFSAKVALLRVGAAPL